MTQYHALGNSERFQEYAHNGFASLYIVEQAGEYNFVWISPRVKQLYAKQLNLLNKRGFGTYAEARQWLKENTSERLD